MITCCQKGIELTFLPISNQNNGWLPFTSCHVFQQPPSCSEIGHTWKMSDKLTKFTSNFWDGLAFRKKRIFSGNVTSHQQIWSPTSVTNIDFIFLTLEFTPGPDISLKMRQFYLADLLFYFFKRRVIGLFHTVNVFAVDHTIKIFTVVSIYGCVFVLTILV